MKRWVNTLCSTLLCLFMLFWRANWTTLTICVEGSVEKRWSFFFLCQRRKWSKKVQRFNQQCWSSEDESTWCEVFCIALSRGKEILWRRPLNEMLLVNGKFNMSTSVRLEDTRRITLYFVIVSLNAPSKCTRGDWGMCTHYTVSSFVNALHLTCLFK